MYKYIGSFKFESWLQTNYFFVFDVLFLLIDHFDEKSKLKINKMLIIIILLPIYYILNNLKQL